MIYYFDKYKYRTLFLVINLTTATNFSICTMLATLLMTPLTVYGAPFGSNSTLQEVIQSRINNAPAVKQQFLKVDEAFQFNFLEIPGGLRLEWIIAPGYYLYHERLNITENGAPLLSAAAIHQVAQPKEDPHFGKVKIYHDALTIDLSLPGENEEYKLIKVQYQGCAEAGLCYPPQTKEIELKP